MPGTRPFWFAFVAVAASFCLAATAQDLCLGLRELPGGAPSGEAASAEARIAPGELFDLPSLRSELKQTDAQIAAEFRKTEPDRERMKALSTRRKYLVTAIAFAEGPHAKASPTNPRWVSGPQQEFLNGLHNKKSITLDYTLAGVRVNGGKAQELPGKITFEISGSSCNVVFRAKWYGRDVEIGMAEFSRTFDAETGRLSLYNARVGSAVRRAPPGMDPLMTDFTLPSKLKVDVPGNPFPNGEVPIHILATMLTLSQGPKPFQVGSVKEIYVQEIINAPAVAELAALREKYPDKDVDYGPLMAGSQSVQYAQSLGSLLGVQVDTVGISLMGRRPMPDLDSFLKTYPSPGAEAEVDAVLGKYGLTRASMRGKPVDAKFDLILKAKQKP